MHYALLWKFSLGYYPSFSNNLSFKISGGAVNNMKDFNFLTFFHTIMIYFSRQITKNKRKKSHRKEKSV